MGRRKSSSRCGTVVKLDWVELDYLSLTTIKLITSFPEVRLAFYRECSPDEPLLTEFEILSTFRVDEEMGCLVETDWKERSTSSTSGPLERLSPLQTFSPLYRFAEGS